MLIAIVVSSFLAGSLLWFNHRAGVATLSLFVATASCAFGYRSVAANPMASAPVKRGHMIVAWLVVLLFPVCAIAALRHFAPF
jgi:hypothetical protein